MQGYTVARFFFDIHDEKWERDDTGVEFAGVDDALAQVKRALPAMAAERITQAGEQHAITVMVTNEHRQPVYTATLSFSGSLMTR